jgi:hypothetical protein
MKGRFAKIIKTANEKDQPTNLVGQSQKYALELNETLGERGTD